MPRIPRLYVDDEPELLEIAKVFLEAGGGFFMATATSAQDVLDGLDLSKYDAIISDYQMPEVDGITFLKRVRSDFGDIPFILFTGRGREDIVIEAIDNGADFYIQKGGDPEAQFVELKHKTMRAIERRVSARELMDGREQLSEIIGFFPDATLAIDADKRVIIWNHAIEEMTGIPASNMIGRGNYAYTLPFYGTARPQIMDLLFDPGHVIAAEYSQSFFICI